MNVTQGLVHTIVVTMAPVQMLMDHTVAHVMTDTLVMGSTVQVSTLLRHDNSVILQRFESKCRFIILVLGCTQRVLSDCLCISVCLSVCQ